MSHSVRKGEPDTLDPDFSAVYVGSDGVSPTNTRARAAACLNVAIKRLCEVHAVEMPEDESYRRMTRRSAAPMARNCRTCI